MAIEKSKILRLFKVKSADLEKNQLEEIKNFEEDAAQRRTNRSGLYIKAYSERYEKHLKEMLEILIDCIFEQINVEEKISNNDQKEIIEIINSFVRKEIEFKQQKLRQVITLVGLDKAGIGSIQTATLQSHFNTQKTLKIDHASHLIEKHNIKVSALKKENSFWKMKGYMITTISTVVVAVASILTFIFSSGIFSSPPDDIERTPHIKIFEIQDEVVVIGNATKVLWDVINADSVLINNGIGRVSVSGERKIFPVNTTRLTISAFWENKIMSVSKTIVVKDSLGNTL